MPSESERRDYLSAAEVAADPRNSDALVGIVYRAELAADPPTEQEPKLHRDHTSRMDTQAHDASANLPPGDLSPTEQEGERWTIYVCDKGHVSHSTLDGVCWQCFPGGRRTWEPGRPKQTEPNQRQVEVVPASALAASEARAEEAQRKLENEMEAHALTLRANNTNATQRDTALARAKELDKENDD